jgi:hypothetical protein
VTFHFRFGSGSLLLGCALTVVVDVRAGTEQTARGTRRAGDSWGRFLAELDALKDQVMSLCKRGRGRNIP